MLIVICKLLVPSQLINTKATKKVVKTNYISNKTLSMKNLRLHHELLFQFDQTVVLVPSPNRGLTFLAPPPIPHKIWHQTASF